MQHRVVLPDTGFFLLRAIHLKTTVRLTSYLDLSQLILMASRLLSGKAALLTKNDNDVVIVAAVRSALTKVPFDGLSSHFLR